MIVRDLYIEGTITAPTETDAELIIDPDRMLTCSISLQSIETNVRRNTEILEAGSDFQLPEFSPRYRFNIYEAFDPRSSRQVFSVRILEGRDHNIDTYALRYYRQALLIVHCAEEFPHPAASRVARVVRAPSNPPRHCSAHPCAIYFR